MLEVEIKILQQRLNHLIGRGWNFKEVYELSVELDRLIAQYYCKAVVNKA